MNTTTIRSAHNRDPHQSSHPRMALIGGGHAHVAPQFGRCYGRSSGYAAARRYVPLSSPGLFRCR